MKFVLKILIIILFYVPSSISAENKGSKWDFYTGMFDYSHSGERAIVLGAQHVNENLYRDSFLGTMQPLTGGFISENQEIYVYSGFQIPKKIGSATFIPSFAPGLFSRGEGGKKMGGWFQMKTELKISFETSDETEFALSYNHISNGNLNHHNPGANSYMFNFIKRF